MRFLSLFFGVLSVPLAHRLMDRLHGREAGLLAALLAATSPFWVYYSQETKMYAQMAFLVLLSSYLFLRAFDGVEEGSPRSHTAPLRVRYGKSTSLRLAYSAISAAAVYTHYFALFALLAHGAYLLFSPRLWEGLRPWLACQALGAALLLPWAVYAASALTWAGSTVGRGSVGLDIILPQTLGAFAAGASLEGALLPWALGGSLALLLLGLLTAPARARLFLLLGLALPILGVYSVSFPPHPGWPRYFMAASPAYYGLMAAGLATLSRRPLVLGAAALLVLAPAGLSLANYYFDPRFARYDYRAQVRELEASSSPQDGVVANGRRGFPAFFYYFDRRLATYILPNRRASDPREIEALLGRLRHSGLWLVKYMPPELDPDNAIEGWLRRNAFALETKWVENVTFTYYSLPREQGLDWTGPAAAFEKGIKLLGYQAQLRPWGDRSVLQVALLWQAERKMSQAYTVFVHVLDGSGQKAGQGDSEPVGGLSPTSSWAPGDSVVDRHGVLLPPGSLGPGARLEIGLYDLGSGARLQILDEQDRPGGTALVLPLP